MNVRHIALLGSTGSIGINTLKVIDQFPKQFRIVALSAFNNYKLLEKQIIKYRPDFVAVNKEHISYFQKQTCFKRIQFLDATKDLAHISSLKSINVVVIAMRGAAALEPFLKAVQSGKRVAPANKEALVMAGDILMREAKKHHAEVIPIDSEQSAIFQCLSGQSRSELKRVFLTASGGPLLNVARSKFDSITVNQVLDHPRWKMGPKITVDSATLMNKGFEVIEAQRLFGLKHDEIKVIIHPQAIIHSMVEFKDGSILAQLAVTDMRLPIQYALTYPTRWPCNLKSLDLVQIHRLDFNEPDYERFPSLKLAIDVSKKGGTLPSVLNAADEEAVEAFLNKHISFSRIYKVVEKVVLKHKIVTNPNLTQILEADEWARGETQRILRG